MIVDFIQRMFLHSFEKEWYETYWAFDLHGTIIKPTYKGTEMIYYPYAKETLQILTKRKDTKLILWTSSFPGEIAEYIVGFAKNGIVWDAVNENSGISSKNGNFGYYEDKFYFNVLFDDKAGFDPEKEWKTVYEFLVECELINFLPKPEWTTKY
jgi:hypothetical protein